MPAPKFGKWSNRRIISHLPLDGCILVFNGMHQSFRTAAQQFDGMVGVYVIDEPKGEKPSGRGLRDLYITLKEDV